jgi:hypothetical protein
MRKYSTVQPIYMSFFSKAFYKDVGENWRGISFLYLFLLLALTWIPLMFKLQSGLNNFIIDEAPKLIRQVPRITISKGEVKTDAEMPYFIRDTNGKPLMAIDTTGKINSLEEAGVTALVTKDKFIIKKSSVETRTFNLSQIEALTIDQSVIYNIAEAIRQWALIILYPVITALSFVYRIIMALVYALAGLLFARSLKADLKYAALISLAIISMTPAIIINTAYNYMELRIPYWFPISFFISMSYLYFAVKANSEKSTPSLNQSGGQ